MVLIFHEALPYDTNICYNNIQFFTKINRSINKTKKKKYSKMIHRITKVHNIDDFCNKYTFVYKEMVAKRETSTFHNILMLNIR